jgi:hypothetical protein
VGGTVSLIYEVFGSGAEFRVIGVASSAARAEELAGRYAEDKRYEWRGPNWIQWDSAQRSPRCRWAGETVKVWIVVVGLDEVTRVVLGLRTSGIPRASASR